MKILINALLAIRPVLLALICFLSFQTSAQDSWHKCFKYKEGSITIHYFNSPNFLSDETGELAGIEYDILQEFKRYTKRVYGVELTLNFEKAESFGGLYQNVVEGTSGEFGACSFSITEQRLQEVKFSPKYMPDIEVMISSKNLPIFEDTLEFMRAAEQYTFLQVPNTTFSEDLDKLSQFVDLGARLDVKDAAEVKSRIATEDDLLGYIELPNYFASLKEGLEFKRQNMFKVERMGYGIIYPLESDWHDVVQLFFSERKTREKINLILQKYFGDDINDLLLQVEGNYQDEVLLLTKEKEMQSLKLENQELLQAKKDADFEAKEADNRRVRIILFVGISFFAAFVIFILIAYKNKSKANKIIEKQHLQLGKTLEEIADSIKYAERLQLAILPLKEDLKNNLGEGFVLFKPKDVVSGDFYWMQKIDGAVLYAVADCTGHGVPGAMVSVVCSNALNRSVKEFGLQSPAAILNKTRELVMETFSRSGKEIRDGMDIAICSHRGDKMIYAGANNPLWIVRESKWANHETEENCRVMEEEGRLILEYRADKQPVGKHEVMKDFSEREIQLYPEDCVYIFTDGYADQFGGPKGKKFKYIALKKLLAKHFLETMNYQKKVLEEVFDEWKGDFEQVDDVAIIGVRID